MAVLYGPVPSRRLGLSLGIDIVPFKTCTLDCIYCQLGRTTALTLKRKKYIRSSIVLKEIKDFLKTGRKIDYITFAGSGEPTLNSDIGNIITGIKKITDIPVAVITNGTLLFRKAVRNSLFNADLVVPSLDSATLTGFKRINRRHNSLYIKKVIEGITRFRREYEGKIWLEIMLVQGFNDTGKELNLLKKAVALIKPDKVQLNTVVRPPAEKYAARVSRKKMKAIASDFSSKCDVIYDRKWKHKKYFRSLIGESILEVLRRRPVTVDDIVASLGLEKSGVIKNLLILEKTGAIKIKNMNGKLFYAENKK